MRLQTGTVLVFCEDLGIGSIQPDNGRPEIPFSLAQGREARITKNGQGAHFESAAASRPPKTGDRVIFHPSTEPWPNEHPTHWAIMPEQKQIVQSGDSQRKNGKGHRDKGGKTDRHCLIAASHRV